MKTRALLVAPALAATLALSACGGSEPTSNPTDASGTTAPTAGGSTDSAGGSTATDATDSGTTDGAEGDASGQAPTGEESVPEGKGATKTLDPSSQEGIAAGKRPAEDVTAVDCAGDGTGTVSLTNSSDTARTYTLEVLATDADGAPLGTLTGTSAQVGPGKTAKVSVTGDLEKTDGQVVCAVEKAAVK